MQISAVYRYRDQAGTLLYIGASSWPVDRISQHVWSRGASMRDVATIEVEWFDSREDARRAEIAAIKAEGPAWNIASRLTQGAA
jgi:excinuclease UvrABC nuclease subunit